MNPVEQRERSTAIQRVERRCEDVEIIVTTIAGDFAHYRKDALEKNRQEALRIADRFQEFFSQIRALERDDREHEKVIGPLRPLAKASTFWQRLRWLIGR